MCGSGRRVSGVGFATRSRGRWEVTIFCFVEIESRDLFNHLFFRDNLEKGSSRRIRVVRAATCLGSDKDKGGVNLLLRVWKNRSAAGGVQQ